MAINNFSLLNWFFHIEATRHNRNEGMSSDAPHKDKSRAWPIFCYLLPSVQVSSIEEQDALVSDTIASNQLTESTSSNPIHKTTEQTSVSSEEINYFDIKDNIIKVIDYLKTLHKKAQSIQSVDKESLERMAQLAEAFRYICHEQTIKMLEVSPKLQHQVDDLRESMVVMHHQKIMDYLKKLHEEAILIQLQPADQKTVSALVQLEEEFHRVYHDQSSNILKNAQTVPRHLNSCMDTIAAIRRQKVMDYLKEIHDKAQSMQPATPEELAQLVQLDKEFQEVYRQQEKNFLKDSEDVQKQMARYATMMTLKRFRAERPKTTGVTTQATPIEKQTVDTAPEHSQALDTALRQALVSQLRRALSQYERALKRIDHQYLEKKNTRYEDVYDTKEKLLTKLDKALVALECGGSIDVFMETYQAALGESREAFQTNRSHPWFRSLISKPLDMLVQQINQIMSAYFPDKYHTVETSLDEQKPAMPFFKSGETQTSADTTVFQEQVQQLISKKI